LELWERTGDVECIAGARNNLGNLAMSQGDFEAALEHHRESLSICSLIGNVQGAVLAQANLAILSIEQSDGQGAVTAAKEALITLGDAGHMLLRGLVHVVLGEGHLECGDLARCQEQFDRALKEFDEATYPLVVAGALRGLGRAALLQGSYTLALERLDGALEIYERLKRDQKPCGDRGTRSVRGGSSSALGSGSGSCTRVVMPNVQTTSCARCSMLHDWDYWKLMPMPTYAVGEPWNPG
jgi:tetratricopeptide (TPR) repeat protein